MTLVKSLKGTSVKSCKCKTWLKHWENNSCTSVLVSYREVTCMKMDLVGEHVIKVNGTDNIHYIVPVCQSHNLSDEEYNVIDDYFVSANKSETCDK